jgi:Golgi SNAP receptor complex protein 2
MERFLLHIHTKAQQENDLIRRKQGLAANPYNPNASMNEQRLYRDGVSLQSSNRLVSELREVGVGVIEKLRAQNSTIKGAQRRLLDIANTIGLSRAVMRLIERRQWQDQILVYSGMAFVLILFFVLVYLFRW